VTPIRIIPRGLGLRRKARLARIRLDERLLAWRRNSVLGRIARRERPLLERARREWTPASGMPLVTVTIATYNRAAILAGRTLPSVVAQTHTNLEVLVIGDCCSDETAELVAAIGDPRITFINLPERGRYPEQRERRHMVAGSVPMAHARRICRGEWIAHLDDDEEWTPDHVETLLARARECDAEIVWGRARYEIAPGEWKVEGSARFEVLDIPHSTVFFRRYLRLFEEDMSSWKLHLGVDRHRFWRMRLAGVRSAFVDRIVTIGALRPGTTRPWAEAEDRDGTP
jgi:glycosyltransferase involved in cell wall biosynthesis